MHLLATWWRLATEAGRTAHFGNYGFLQGLGPHFPHLNNSTSQEGVHCAVMCCWRLVRLGRSCPSGDGGEHALGTFWQPGLRGFCFKEFEGGMPVGGDCKW